ncbi:MAG: LbtU family siderophore porin [Desulfuromonadales bacterium]
MLKLQHSLIVNIAVLLTGLLVMATPALAIHPEEKSEIENLKKRIEMLETRQTATASTEQESGVDFGQISKYVTLHGLLEAEAYYARPEGGEEESDLNLATAELSIEVTLNDYVGGHLTLLYEEEEGEEDDIDVDEAVISLGSPGQLFGQTPSLHVGRMYVPFGMFNSYMISDPLTLELGETRDTAALFALEGDVWVLKAGGLNGETDANGDSNHIDNWVASLEFTPVENLAFGVSYINDLAESDNELVQDETLYSSNVAGASAFLSVQCGQFGFEAEYLTALEDFDSALVGIGEDLTGRRPSALNLELAWMPTEKLQLAARYEEANDFQDNVKRYGVTASYGLYEHVVVALEYLRADADIAEDDTVDIVTAQLAFEF